jgi:thiol-disulfide isomerase/thioredoxin
VNLPLELSTPSGIASTEGELELPPPNTLDWPKSLHDGQISSMKNLVLTITLSASTLVGAVSPVEAAAAAPQGIEVWASGVASPKSQFVNPQGVLVTLSDFKGKTIVLNVWATWCAPCIKEMPSLDRLSEKLGNGKAMVLAVNQDKGGAAIAKPFLEKLRIKNLLAYTDPSSKLSRDLGIRGLPTTFIISSNGTFIGRAEGALEWDSPEVIRFILSHDN